MFTNSIGDQQSSRRKDVLILFDVDGTITPARQPIEDDLDSFLQSLKKSVSIGLVGGSDLNKIAWQTLPSKQRSNDSTRFDPVETCLSRYDYVFAENGLVAFRDGQAIAKQSIANHLGEERLQKFINFCLAYMSKIELPVKRGNFIEFRNGMINVCPVGRSCSQQERDQFNAYDGEHKIREKFIEQLEAKFGPKSDDPLGLVYAIGGQISFDAYPQGWDKTFCLDLVDKSFKEIHFFGDKTEPGGNDHEIHADHRTIGHSVKCPSDTLAQLKELKLVSSA